MGKYSLVERCMLIPYDNIEGKYHSDVKFILSVNFLVLVYIKYY